MRRTAPVTGILCVILAASVVFSYAVGPPDKRTGAPGESTCAFCHQNLNIGSGSIWLVGPTGYAPAETLLFTLHLALTGQQAWGFELTVLDSVGNPFGTILRLDTIRTQTSLNANGRTYLKHTLAGTDPGVLDTAPGWQFFWVAPQQLSGPATVYACGNAADWSGDNLGDFCYTLVQKISAGGCCTDVTGNVNMAGIVDLSDLSLLIAYLTVGAVLPCPTEANVDAKGIVDLSDLAALIRYLSVGDYQFPPCSQ